MKHDTGIEKRKLGKVKEKTTTDVVATKTWFGNFFTASKLDLIFKQLPM